jgi:hypothetical protein
MTKARRLFNGPEAPQTKSENSTVVDLIRFPIPQRLQSCHVTFRRRYSETLDQPIWHPCERPTLSVALAGPYRAFRALLSSVSCSSPGSWWNELIARALAAKIQPSGDFCKQSTGVDQPTVKPHERRSDSSPAQNSTNQSVSWRVGHQEVAALLPGHSQFLEGAHGGVGALFMEERCDVGHPAYEHAAKSPRSWSCPARSDRASPFRGTSSMVRRRRPTSMRNGL